VDIILSFVIKIESVNFAVAMKQASVALEPVFKATSNAKSSGLGINLTSESISLIISNALSIYILLVRTPASSTLNTVGFIISKPLSPE